MDDSLLASICSFVEFLHWFYDLYCFRTTCNRKGPGFKTSITDQWWLQYEKALSFMDSGLFDEASSALRQAISQKNVDKRHANTYRFSFIDYFPHRELGIVLYHQGRFDEAIKELTKSLESMKSSKAYLYRDKARLAKLLDTSADHEHPKIEIELPNKDSVSDDLVVSDAFREMRPLLNVAPFERKALGTNNALSYGTENILSQIISSRGRFKIWHDPKLRETIQEQNLSQQNLSQRGLEEDRKTRIKGFSGLVLFGSILQRKSSLEISAWLCDTERSVEILEVDAFREVVDSDGLEEICSEIERKISREFPLVQGRIAKVKGSRILLDFGKEVRIKSGMKVFLYRSERVPKHIDTDLVCEATVLNKADNGLFISELIDDWCVGYVREGQWAITQ